MQESYKEGDAHHFDPESCLDDPRGRGEALTGESTGGLLSSEITSSRMPTRLTAAEGKIKSGDKTRDAFEFGGVVEPGMCGHSLRGNRDTSRRSLDGTEASIPEATGKVNSHTPVVSSPEESDGVIVPEKWANNGTTIPAESMEGRTPTERKATTSARFRSQNRIDLSIGSRCLRRKHKRDGFKLMSQPTASVLKVGAVCGSSARTDLYGGHSVTSVPTVTYPLRWSSFPHRY